MFSKLFMAMGLTWFLELLAWIISEYTAEGQVDMSISVILNIPNVLQGVLIFLVFGLKKSASEAISQKLRKSQRNRSLQRSTNSSESSTTSTISNKSQRGISARVSTNPNGSTAVRKTSLP